MTIDAAAVDVLLDERGLSKLRWRCRRGLLENDLFIERFFERYASGLTVRQAQAMDVLMALADNELLDLLLGRKPPEGDWVGPDELALIALLRTPRTTPVSF